MLVEASKVFFASNEQDFCSPEDAVEVEWFCNFFCQNDVDNLNKIFLEDANVTYFDNDYIGCSICRRGKCTDCKVLLLTESERQKQIEKDIPQDYMSLFDDANRRLSAITELCYAVTTLVVQGYIAVLSHSGIRTKFLYLINSDVFLLKRCCVFFVHQLLSLTSVVPQTMKTLH